MQPCRRGRPDVIIAKEACGADLQQAAGRLVEIAADFNIAAHCRALMAAALAGRWGRGCRGCCVGRGRALLLLTLPQALVHGLALQALQADANQAAQDCGFVPRLAAIVWRRARLCQLILLEQAALDHSCGARAVSLLSCHLQKDCMVHEHKIAVSHCEHDHARSAVQHAL